MNPAGLSAMGVLGEANNTVLVILIVIITLLAIASVVSGLGRGIKWLSNINLSMMGVLLVSVLVLGPTLFLLRDFVQSLGVYLANVLNMTFDAGAYTGDAGQEWMATWTIFYWGWWMAWAPFVGVFIARISRGRTIRQFIAGVLLVPTVLGFLWLAALGGTGIYQQLYGQGGLVDPEQGVIAEEALFLGLEQLPLGAVLSVLAIVLVAIFFVSGADAASVVMGTLSQRGSIEPSRWVVIFWGAATGAVAAIMLVIGGNNALEGIQNLTFMGALPFAIVMVIMCFALMKDLRNDPITLREEKGYEVLEQAVITGVEEHEGDFQLEVTPAESTDDEDASPNGQVEAQVTENGQVVEEAQVTGNGQAGATAASRSTDGNQ